MISNNKKISGPFPAKIERNKTLNSNKLGIAFFYLLIIGILAFYFGIAYEETEQIENIFTKMFKHLL